MKLTFETSKDLKQLFNEEMEKWRKRERLGLEDMARKCGVSPAYLAHVGRYGRIPSKPVLILLALNFQMPEPERLLRTAEFKDPWPYDSNITLAPKSATEEGFLSLKLDMGGFTSAIREIVRGEIKPRSVPDLLRGRPLRVGINPLKHWLFNEESLKRRDGKIQGFFTEFCSMFALSQQCRIEFKLVEYASYQEQLARDQIDMFGPIVNAPNLPAGTTFSAPLYRIGMSALMRTSPTTELPALSAPKTIEQLIDGPYQIAVIKNSRAHLLANTRFKRDDSSLLVCNSYEEALDRIMLRGIARPAHVFVCNSVDTRLWHDEHRRDTQMLFTDPEHLIDFAECGVAIRSEWQELVTAINDFVSFLDRSGTLTEMFSRWAPKDMQGLIEPLTPAINSSINTKIMKLKKGN